MSTNTYVVTVTSIDASTGRPDNSLPGGAPVYPGHALPQPPLGIWGGGNVPMPTPPIVIVLPPNIGAGHPDNTLPGAPVYPTTGPVPTPPAGVVTPPIAPTPEPKKA